MIRNHPALLAAITVGSVDDARLLEAGVELFVRTARYHAAPRATVLNPHVGLGLAGAVEAPCALLHVQEHNSEPK